MMNVTVSFSEPNYSSSLGKYYSRLVFCLLAVLAGPFLCGLGIFFAVHSLDPASWPTADGVIEYCKFVRAETDGGQVYRVDVVYSYFAHGVRHRATRFAIGYDMNRWESIESAIYEKVKNARSVTVRYDPENPTNAVLAYGANHVALVVFFFVAPNIFVELTVIALWIFVRRSRKEAEQVVPTGISNKIVIT